MASPFLKSFCGGWFSKKDVVALSRTEREERIRENLNIFDFFLEEGDMNAIYRLAQRCSRIVDPPGLAALWDSTPPFHATA
jgi:2,5-diketo-D-gluconate reductase B